MSEQRSSVRQRSFLQGRVYFNNRCSSIDCVIRDISETGARLKFSDAIALPDVVELHIPNKRETHQVRVRWRHGGEMGVSFIHGEPINAVTTGAGDNTDLAQRLQRLESEVNALRCFVNELRADQHERHSQQQPPNHPTKPEELQAQGSFGGRRNISRTLSNADIANEPGIKSADVQIN